MTDPLVLAIDQGTSSTKCLLVGAAGQVVSRGSAALDVSYPQPGWVEQSAEEIWSSVVRAAAACLAGQDSSRVVAVGLSTQRESILLWERATGRPVGPMLGWQDQRTSQECERLRGEGAAPFVRATSGLPLDPMFSAMKAQWLLDRYDADRSRSSRGELCLGTVDSWLLWQLTGEHRIEIGNASRTQLFDVRERGWSGALLDLFRVPAAVLPEVVSSSGRFGSVRGLPGLDAVPLTGVLADSHAALFAHGARAPGLVKATFGTGTSVMGLVASPGDVGEGLCLTIAWEHGRTAYAAEGNIRASGALIVWAAKLLGTDPQGIFALAAAGESGDVDIVPAFGGLAAPWWDDQAVGLVTGLTLGTGPEQLARAVTEAVGLQVADLTAAIEAGCGPIEALLVDGGAAANDSLMQLQADLSQVQVRRARAVDLSALGAAHLAGMAADVWDGTAVEAFAREQDVFTPAADQAQVASRRTRWHEAIARSRFRSAPST